jgi:hypothetical protein
MSFAIDIDISIVFDISIRRTTDNVTFYLARPLHFLSYQLNRLLRRSDLPYTEKKIDIRIVLMTFYFLKPKTIIVNLTAKF